MDIYHLVLPKASNNFKARALHSSVLFVIAAFLVLFQYSLSFLSSPSVNILGYAANIPPEKVVEITNQKRVENGVGTLTYSTTLSEAARQKALDMLEDDYWAHVAPDGTEPWDFFRNVGYSYRYAGENLARDFSDTNSAVEAWLASPSHRENMLASKYTEIGVAVVEGDLGGNDTTLIVQLLGTPSNQLPSVPVASAETNNAILETQVAQAAALPEDPIAPVVEELPVVEGIAEPLIEANQFDVVRAVTMAVVFAMLLILATDLVMIYKRGITRVGGRTFAHLSFIAMVFIILLIVRGGQII